MIKGGESIVLSVPETKNTGKQLIFPLHVIFEDEHLAAIHKPAGILVSGNSFKTVARALPKNLKPSRLADATTPQPVHRLDYATTGILLVGKTHSAIRALNQLFVDKVVTKTYYAITIGQMELAGEVSTSIDDKPSVSHYTSVASTPSERFDMLHLVKLDPKTGRRHQLRKHMAYNGNPILGDKDYGTEGLILNGKGLYLHAHSVQFIHPFTEKEMHLTDPLPQRFCKIFPSYPTDEITHLSKL